MARGKEIRSCFSSFSPRHFLKNGQKTLLGSSGGGGAAAAGVGGLGGGGPLPSSPPPPLPALVAGTVAEGTVVGGNSNAAMAGMRKMKENERETGRGWREKHSSGEERIYNYFGGHFFFFLIFCYYLLEMSTRRIRNEFLKTETRTRYSNSDEF